MISERSGGANKPPKPIVSPLTSIANEMKADSAVITIAVFGYGDDAAAIKDFRGAESTKSRSSDQTCQDRR